MMAAMMPASGFPAQERVGIDAVVARCGPEGRRWRAVRKATAPQLRATRTAGARLAALSAGAYWKTGSGGRT